MRWLGLLLLLVAACGGGGGSGPLPALEQQFSFGIVRADAPTTKSVTVANPIAADATVEEMGGAGGPFAPEAGALPADVAAGAGLKLRIVFTPTAPGTQEAEVHLRFAAGKQAREVVLMLSANVETPVLTVLTPTLSFDAVVLGDQQALDARVRNDSQQTLVAVTAVSALPADFTASFTPRTLLPGDTLAIRVTFEPQATGDYDFFFDVTNDAGAAADVRVIAQATPFPAEQVTDFGNVALSNGQTGWLSVDVPADGIGLSIEAVAADASVVPGLLGFEGPGGKVYENDQATGAFLWAPGSYGVFAASLPESDKPDVQLVPGGGTYRFRLYLLFGSAGTLHVRAIVESRPNAVANDGVLDLNVFLAPGLSITNPATNTKLQAVLSRMDDIFAQVGLHLGDVSYYQLTNSAYNSVSDTEFPQMLAESSVASAVRANVFFVQSTLSGGTIGVAAELPGPKLNGTQVSGVMVDYDWSSDPAAIGQVAAHEVGHYLGLYHTAEQDGVTWDIIDDTLECPGQCTTPSGGYLMHWQFAASTLPTITAGEAHVILAHPLVDPASGLAGLSALAQKSAPQLAWVELPAGFCGTCAKRK